jgi:hypothetical protein
MSLGDTSIAYDPLAAQGANSGLRQIACYVDAITARDGDPFDEEWMAATFADFYSRHGMHAQRLSNVYLGQYPDALHLVVLAAYADGAVADGMIRLFVDPAWHWPLADRDAALAFIAETSGKDPQAVLAHGAALVEAAQATLAAGRTVFSRPRPSGSHGFRAVDEPIGSGFGGTDRT